MSFPTGMGFSLLNGSHRTGSRHGRSRYRKLFCDAVGSVEIHDSHADIYLFGYFDFRYRMIFQQPALLKLKSFAYSHFTARQEVLARGHRYQTRTFRTAKGFLLMHLWPRYHKGKIMGSSSDASDGICYFQDTHESQQFTYEKTKNALLTVHLRIRFEQ